MILDCNLARGPSFTFNASARSRRRVWTAAGVLALLAGAVSAQETTVRGGFSGNWADPAQSGHGIQVSVVDEHRAGIVWYTFDPSGNPVWLLGVGEIEGNRIEAELDLSRGAMFPPDFESEDIVREDWGSVTVIFDDCQTGSLSWSPAMAGWDAGSMPLERVTRNPDARCAEAESFERVASFSLDAGPGRWTGEYADYGQPQADLIDFESGRTQLPEPLDDRHGFKLAGTNRSDDLAMLLKHPVGGLQPDTEYTVEMEMTFATHVPQNCVGVGGPPGEGVAVKLGAAGVEPVVEQVDDDFVFNIDKGNQQNSGEDAVRVGDLTNRQSRCVDFDERIWQAKTVSTRDRSFTARTDAQGRLWVYGVTDSGFESRSTIYVTRFEARLRRAAG